MIDGLYLQTPRGRQPAVALNLEDWIILVKRWKEHGIWPETLGPAPGALGCVAPTDVLQEIGNGSFRAAVP